MRERQSQSHRVGRIPKAGSCVPRSVTSSARTKVHTAADVTAARPPGAAERRHTNSTTIRSHGAVTVRNYVPRRGAGPGPGTRPGGQRQGRRRARSRRWASAAGARPRHARRWPTAPGGKPRAEQIRDPGRSGGGVGDDPGDQITVAAAGQDGAARVGQQLWPKQRPPGAASPGPCHLPPAQFASVSDGIPGQAGLAQPGGRGSAGDPIRFEQHRQAFSSQVEAGEAVLDRVAAGPVPGQCRLRYRDLRAQGNHVRIELQVMVRADPQAGAEHSRVAVRPADSITPQRIVGHGRVEQRLTVHTMIQPPGLWRVTPPWPGSATQRSGVRVQPRLFTAAK